MIQSFSKFKLNCYTRYTVDPHPPRRKTPSTLIQTQFTTTIAYLNRSTHTNHPPIHTMSSSDPSSDESDPDSTATESSEEDSSSDAQSDSDTEPTPETKTEEQQKEKDIKKQYPIGEALKKSVSHLDSVFFRMQVLFPKPMPPRAQSTQTSRNRLALTPLPSDSEVEAPLRLSRTSSQTSHHQSRFNENEGPVALDVSDEDAKDDDVEEIDPLNTTERQEVKRPAVAKPTYTHSQHSPPLPHPSNASQPLPPSLQQQQTLPPLQPMQPMQHQHHHHHSHHGLPSLVTTPRQERPRKRMPVAKRSSPQSLDDTSSADSGSASELQDDDSDIEQKEEEEEEARIDRQARAKRKKKARREHERRRRKQRRQARQRAEGAEARARNNASFLYASQQQGGDTSLPEEQQQHLQQQQRFQTSTFPRHHHQHAQQPIQPQQHPRPLPFHPLPLSSSSSSFASTMRPSTESLLSSLTRNASDNIFREPPTVPTPRDNPQLLNELHLLRTDLKKEKRRSLRLKKGYRKKAKHFFKHTLIRKCWLQWKSQVKSTKVNKKLMARYLRKSLHGAWGQWKTYLKSVQDERLHQAMEHIKLNKKKLEKLNEDLTLKNKKDREEMLKKKNEIDRLNNAIKEEDMKKLKKLEEVRRNQSLKALKTFQNRRLKMSFNTWHDALTTVRHY